jgi:hypothetical protein
MQSNRLRIWMDLVIKFMKIGAVVGAEIGPMRFKGAISCENAASSIYVN